MFAGHDKIPLNAFEEYMLLDDRPDYPMTMPTTLVFKGKADFDLLSRAFDDSVATEPFFRAIVRNEKGINYWVPAPASPVLVNRSEENAPLVYRDGGTEEIFSFDLRDAPGVLCEYAETTDGFRIRLQIHHAICDGLAAMRFAGNWFGRYGELIGDTEGVSSMFPTGERLLQREDFQIVLPHPLSRWTIAKSLMSESSHWFLRRPSRLMSLPEKSRMECRDQAEATTTNIPENLKRRPYLHWVRLPETFFDAYRAAAKARKISINSLYLGDYFSVLSRWLELGNPGRSIEKNWIRVLLPTNLRKSSHADMPAANMLGYAFLDRRVGQCRNRETLDAGIHQDVEAVKKWSMGSMFLSGVSTCRKIPGGLSMATSKRFCHATSIMSNIGCPCKTLLQRRFHRAGTIDVGDAGLLQLIGGPPIRPNTPFSAGLMLQGRFWTLSILADHAVMDTTDILLFQKTLLDQLSRTARQE